MRGTDEVTGSLLSYVDLEERIPARHPLRKVRRIVNDALISLDAEFDRLYAAEGRPSIAPEGIVRGNCGGKVDERSVGLSPVTRLGPEPRNTEPVPRQKRGRAIRGDSGCFL
jgi:hypothetical protein